MTSKIENIYEVGSHEFSRNQKCYEWFSMISGHGNEKLFFMEIEILGLRAPKTSQRLRQVRRFSCWASHFYTLLAQWAKVLYKSSLTKSLTKTSKKWPWASKM